MAKPLDDAWAPAMSMISWTVNVVRIVTFWDSLLGDPLDDLLEVIEWEFSQKRRAFEYQLSTCGPFRIFVGGCSDGFSCFGHGGYLPRSAGSGRLYE